MTSNQIESNVNEGQYPSAPTSQAPSQASRSLPFSPYQQPSHYPIPRAIPQKSLFGRRRKKGRGRSYIILGALQVSLGVVCFVLALVGLSITTSGTSYSPGFVAGICFIAAGIFGCIVGTSDSQCYVMTYLVLNILSIVTGLMCIGLSGWEIHGLGTPSRVLTSEGFYTVKCIIVIISCVSVFIIALYQAYRLRNTHCCSCKENPSSGERMQGYAGPMAYHSPASNPTTNSSWNWNIQHNVNQNRPGDLAIQQQDLQQRYLNQMQTDPDAIPVQAYTHQDQVQPSYDYPPRANVVPSRYDPATDTDVHIQPAYI